MSKNSCLRDVTKTYTTPVAARGVNYGCTINIANNGLMYRTAAICRQLCSTTEQPLQIVMLFQDASTENPVTIDTRIFIYLDVLPADFSKEISVIKTAGSKMALASGQPLPRPLNSH